MNTKQAWLETTKPDYIYEIKNFSKLSELCMMRAYPNNEAFLSETTKNAQYKNVSL